MAIPDHASKQSYDSDNDDDNDAFMKCVAPSEIATEDAQPGGVYMGGETNTALQQIQHQHPQQTAMMVLDPMQNLPGWWIKKVWHSYDGWLLVAKKDEFSLLVTEAPRQVDQRNLVEETIGSENRNESQRQNQAATMSKNALQQCLHLADDALLRARPRSPRGARGEAAARALPPQDQDEEATMPQALWGNWVWHSPDTSSLKLRCLQHRVFQSPALAWLVTSEISA